MQDSSRHFRVRLRGCVNQQRPHRDDPALGNNAIDWRNASCDFVNAVIAQDAQCVRPCQDTERPIRSGRIVKVNAQRQHFGQRGGRSVCVVDSLLNGSRPPAWQFEPRAKWQGSILMPYHQPVRRSRFVEHGGAKWKCIWPQDTSSQFNHLRLLTQLGNGSESESVPHPSTTPSRL